jgi:hypothetical protein
MDYLAILIEEYHKLSDAEVLARLVALPTLPEEENAAWDNDNFWREVAEPYLVLGDVIATRKLKSGVKPLLERACYGDPGEIMRGLCHTLEKAVDGDSEYLLQVCLEATKHLNPGARLWAVHEIGRIRKATVLDVLENALHDEKELVREQAKVAIEKVTQSV